jgi:short-subunit dehydrogenase
MKKNYWSDTTAVITGASSGIGASIAKKFSAQGIKVILVARNVEKLERLAAGIRANGGKAEIFPCDLSVSPNRVELIKQITENSGVPDILVNNAGIGWFGYFSQMPWDVAAQLLALDIEAPTHLTSLLLPQMIKSGKPCRIINMGSITGKMPEQGIALYSGAKSYIDSFTKSVLREIKGTHVRISVMRPGPVKTNFFDNSETFENGGRIPAEKSAITPERIANAAWNLVNHPHRFIYIPAYMYLSPFIEYLFAPVIDLVGPIMLRHRLPNSHP